MVTIRNITRIFTFLMIMAFGSNEMSKYLTDAVETFTKGILIIPPTLDTPVMGQYLLAALFFLLVGETFDVYLRANYSPQIMGAGLRHPHSFNGHVKRDSGFAVIAAGGSASPIPYPGTHYIIVPRTHMHMIGEHIIITAGVTEGRPISEVPIEVKSFVRSCRGGLFGVKDAAIGWLTQDELQNNKTFEWKHGDKTRTVSTSGFLTKEASFSKMYNGALELHDNEAGGLSAMLRILSEIGGRELSGDSGKSWISKHIFKHG